MLSGSNSSFSFGQHSDESVLSHRILGLPDVLTKPDVITRPLRGTNGHLCLQIDDICRICHGGNSSGDLLMPCRCKGTIALAHLRCLEIWLNESDRDECELCQYHFRIIRQPKYNVPRSILLFIRHPGEHLRELLVDVVTLVVYTPSTITSTYMLMMLCESLKVRKTVLSQIMGLTAICGIAAINFTYTSWLVLAMEKYYQYWREWYRRHSSLKVILSARKINANRFTSNRNAVEI